METAEQQTAVLTIAGMACSGCANTVQQALDNLEGELASVVFNPEVVSTEALGKTVEEAGYKFKDAEN